MVRDGSGSFPWSKDPKERSVVDVPVRAHYSFGWRSDALSVWRRGVEKVALKFKSHGQCVGQGWSVHDTHLTKFLLFRASVGENVS